MWSLLFRSAGALAWAAMLLSQPARADEAVWKLLQGGGQVVMIRHALTDPGVGDPEGMKLDECASQRNLNGEGRAHARRVGDAFKARGVVVGRLLSSPWCRCVETARLAFGSSPQTTPALGNLFGRPQLREQQLAQLKPLAGDPPSRGNTVLVSHGSTIYALTGVSPGTGEMVVLTPQGMGRFSVAGRISVH